MVSSQIKSRNVADERVLSAVEKVPRHLFVPPDLKDSAYEDRPLPVGEGQTVSQPFIVALMSQCLELAGKEKILEIGTGSGYQSAILAELSEMVYTVERIEKLSLAARKVIEELGYLNVIFKVGDGSCGWEEHAPYDAIIVTAAAPEAPECLVEQLAEGGRMVIPVGPKSLQELVVIKKQGAAVSRKEVSGCVFVPLIGKYGHEHSC